MHSVIRCNCIYKNFTHNQLLKNFFTDKIRFISVSSKKWSNENVSQDQDLTWNDKFKRWNEAFQVFVGLADIKQAHENVNQLSKEAQGYASIRRELYEKLEDVHNQRYYDFQKMTHTDIGSEEYQKLQDKHYELKSQLRVLRTDFRNCERRERNTFEQLFLAMRECNRKEGYLAEQSKYWSIIASVISAVLASLFTSINHWRKFAELREIMEEDLNKETKISSDDLDIIRNIVQDATNNIPQNEIKIGSNDLKQIETIVKEATDVVSEKMIDKHYSNGISKVMSDEKSNRAMVVGASIGTSLGAFITAMFFLLIDSDD